MSGLGLTFLRRGGQAHPTAGSDYIKFKDEAVFNILIANGVSSDGVGITKDDAARVTNISTWFAESAIRSFDELQFFTGLTYLSSSFSATSRGAFDSCDELESVVLPLNLQVIGDFSFRDCYKLKSIGDTSRITMIRREALNNTLIPELILPSCTSLAGCGYYSAISKIVAPLLTALSGSVIRMQNLEYLEVGELLSSIATYTFWQMTTDKTIFICRAVLPPSLDAYNNMNFCKAIYVPDASLDAYKAASGWSSYTSKIKPLSEYTE